MGTYVCQTCDAIIGYFEDEKVSILYTCCDHCEDHCHQDVEGHKHLDKILS